ncbi:hypothetical protein H4O18_14780 [Arenibacter sp. BSSL-BM3]|uniref:Uncharacterized protein n=1 Tax=Arenibacter arenosicollis TaxID=2762274 RepID=A0ABR7QQA1_9FLAO|nr:hypothetical protein [Arenibacter arenosicollis]MBC8769259.1 hypothetical protein [Arenibacter arenosicollis]
MQPKLRISLMEKSIECNNGEYPMFCLRPTSGRQACLPKTGLLAEGRDRDGIPVAVPGVYFVSPNYVFGSFLICFVTYVAPEDELFI